MREFKPSPAGRGFTAGRSLLVRVFALAILFAAINGWVIRHLGLDLTELASLNLVVGVVGILSGWLRESEREHVEGERARLLRRVLDWILDPGALAGIAVVFLILGSFVTSVTIFADGIAGNREVRVAPEGEAQTSDGGQDLAGAEDHVRFLCWTTPFGRPFYVEVDGYLRHSFDLFPWKGASLRLRTHLQPSPAVLLRVPFEWFAVLGGGQLRIRYGERSHDATTREGQASLLLGRRAAIPMDLLGIWRAELVRDGREPSEIERALLSWRNPIRVEETADLRPDSVVEFELLSRVGKQVAEGTFTVTSESFQDVSPETFAKVSPSS